MNREATNAYPQELIDLAGAVSAAGKVLYAVGGCVRDALLTGKRHDIDVASALRPEEMRTLLDRLGVPYRAVSPRLGTLLLWPDTHRIEYTAFRTESYGAGGAHAPERVAFTDELALDARRRDFSVNALYQDILTGAVCDPTGGLADLKAHVLRTTAADPVTILRDDGLRILRLCRFSARLGFTVDGGTWDAARAQSALLADVAWERKRDELLGILTGPAAADALTMLYKLGALPYVLPELVPCAGVAQRADYHRYDVLTHCFFTVEEIPPEPPLRLAALLHDVGKPAAKKRDGTMHGHDALGVPLAEAALNRLRIDRETVKSVAFLIRWHMYDLTGRAKEPTLRIRFCRWGEARTEALILLREADIRGSGVDPLYRAERWRRVLADLRRDGVPFCGVGLRITGEEIMRVTALPPGPQIGALKERLCDHCAVRPADNTPERLSRILRDMQ